MKSSHLYLTGYRGCGKSTVGKQLASRLNLPFCDLDDVVESSAGMTIAAIFDAEQEAGFRDRESASLRQVAQRPQQIISLGGGAILRESNRALISRTGWCVWLDADPGLIADRLNADATTQLRRPSLTQLPMASEIKTIMNARAPLYREVADFYVDTSDRSIDQIVEAIQCEFAKTV